MTVHWEEQKGSRWQPEVEGDTVEGVVIDVQDAEFGKEYVIKQKEDVDIVTPAHKDLIDKMRAVGIGNVVKIEFVKKVETKKGQACIYKVFKARDDGKNE